MVAFLVVDGAAFGQPPSPKPAFEVASVRPSPPKSAPSVRGLEINPDRVHIGPMVLINLIAVAYGVENYQVQGPAWLTEVSGITLFDIDATLPLGTSRPAALEMLQNLLAERFLLKVEIGSTEVDALTLTVAKDGLKLPRREANGRAAEPAKDYKGSPLFQIGAARMAMSAEGAHVESFQIDGLIEYFKIRFLPTPVLDETGLTGQYDIKLDFPTPDLTGLRAGDSAEGGQRVMDAVSMVLAKQGLRLDRRKRRIKSIIVNNVEKNPTAN